VKKIVYRMFGADPGGDDFYLPVRWRKSAGFWRMKVVARAHFSAR